MNKYYNDFVTLLENEDKFSSLDFCLSRLINGELDIVTLYEEILKPALNSIDAGYPDSKLRIWREHARSSIARTIIECCYPYVIKERDKKFKAPYKGKAAVICPDGELHELGARMAADYFTLCGFDSLFIGSSTPKDEFIDVINVLRPLYIAISVSNYFNIVAARKTIEEIRSKSRYSVKIIAGGSAFKNNREAYKEIGADALAENFTDIMKFTNGGI